MTDALARWCLAEVEAGGNPWAELESLVEDLPSPTCESCAGDNSPPSPTESGVEDSSPPSPTESGVEDSSLPSPSGRGAGGEGNSSAQWIEGLRKSGRLRNDDVTLLAILL